MACHKSSKKSIRKTLRQTAVNSSRLTRIKTFIKKVEIAVNKSADKVGINQAFSNAQKEIMKGVSHDILHRNAAARKISRLTKKVKSAFGEAYKQ